jgi:oligopeptidase B
MKAPIANKIPTPLVAHNDTRTDDYFWLNDIENPAVKTYLESENSYTQAQMADTEGLQEHLYQEMKARYKKDDASLPYFFNQYWHVVKYKEGFEYPFFYRHFEDLEAPEELILDVNLLAKKYKYFDIGSLSCSPCNRYLAYGFDVKGDRKHHIQIKDLQTGELLSESFKNTSGKVVWSADSQYFFYIKLDNSFRAYKVFRHQLGTDPKQDVLIFHEKNEAFDVYLSKSKSQEYIFLSTSCTSMDEHHFLNSQSPLADFTCIQARSQDLEYSVEQYQDQFYIITNHQGATNFKMMTCPISMPSMAHWQALIPHREDVLLEGFEIFNDYLVIEEREQGLLKIQIRPWGSTTPHYLHFEEATYNAYIDTNLAFDSQVLRYSYSSLTQASTIFDYHMATGEQTVVKITEVLDEKYKASELVAQRLWATAKDGTQIPISLVYHQSTEINAKTPLLLYAYGSYGLTIDASFSSVRLSLLQRGFVYAIAHVRGGEYLGRPWYEDGKLLKKKNTFSDFIACAEFLHAQNYSSAEHSYAMGGSAGGLLMGVVSNTAPELFNGIVAQVPFVDVMTTMLDDTLPLTIGEYEEWGNPNEPVFYDYMKSYSPYDQVSAQAYPHMLVTTGINDSQVQYWEPAKWVAKLRAYKTNQNMLLLKTDMDAGHGGASGRFESLKDDAFEYAFLLKLEGITAF